MPTWEETITALVCAVLIGTGIILLNRFFNRKKGSE